MKFKYYVRGAGVGILITTIVFMIGVNMKGGIMSDERAIARAIELGYTALDASGDAGLTQEDLDLAAQGKTGTSDGSTDGTASADSQGAQGDAASTTDSGSADATDATNATTTSGVTIGTNTVSSLTAVGLSETDVLPSVFSAEQLAILDAYTTGGDGSLVTVEIPDTNSSRGFSEALFSAGLIDNLEVFNRYLENRGYDSFLHNGTYQIPAGSTYLEIATILMAH